MRSGFEPTKAKRLGELGEDNEKSISEAILALPFYLDGDGNPNVETLQAAYQVGQTRFSDFLLAQTQLFQYQIAIL